MTQETQSASQNPNSGWHLLSNEDMARAANKASETFTPNKPFLISEGEYALMDENLIAAGLAVPIEQALAQIGQFEGCAGYRLKQSEWLDGVGYTWASVTFDFVQGVRSLTLPLPFMGRKASIFTIEDIEPIKEMLQGFFKKHADR